MSKISRQFTRKQAKAKSIKSAKKARLKSWGFYGTREWRALRLLVFNEYGYDCMACGREGKKNDSKVHVNHIKPASKYPELKLDFDNLQVLCKKCSQDKSNLHCTDYRPNAELMLERLDNSLLETLPVNF